MIFLKAIKLSYHAKNCILRKEHIYFWKNIFHFPYYSFKSLHFHFSPVLYFINYYLEKRIRFILMWKPRWKQMYFFFFLIFFLLTKHNFYLLLFFIYSDFWSLIEPILIPSTIYTYLLIYLDKQYLSNKGFAFSINIA